MPRLFVAVWPSPDVVEMLRAIPHGRGDVRWTTEEQWHVTLRFLGRVDEADVTALDDALVGAALQCSSAAVTLGAPLRRLGSALALTVTGLDEIAAAVIDATSGFGQPPEPRRFQGHLTIARSKQRRGPRSVPSPVREASWTADEITVVQSHLGQGLDRTSRYEIIRRYQLG